MNKIAGLQNKLASLSARHSEIEIQHEAARAELTTARSSLLAGEPTAIETVTAAQARTTALSEALSALTEKTMALRAEYRVALEVEQEAARTARLDELGDEFKAIRREIEAARERASKALAVETTFIMRCVFRHRELSTEESSLTGRPRRDENFFDLAKLDFGHAVDIAWSAASERESAADQQRTNERRRANLLAAKATR
ncbi:MAG: hypothetical protein WKF30_02365 [Pyrinomonadaceae bacterium]